MNETARDTLDETNADALTEAQGKCEKPVSRNCERTALCTVILNMPDGALTVPCCEPCKDEHVKRAKAEGVPVTVRPGTPIEAGPLAPGWRQRVRGRLIYWSGWQWLALGVVVILLLIGAVAVLRLLLS